MASTAAKPLSEARSSQRARTASAVSAVGAGPALALRPCTSQIAAHFARGQFHQAHKAVAASERQCPAVRGKRGAADAVLELEFLEHPAGCHVVDTGQIRRRVDNEALAVR